MLVLLSPGPVRQMLLHCHFKEDILDRNVDAVPWAICKGTQLLIRHIFMKTLHRQVSLFIERCYSWKERREQNVEEKGRTKLMRKVQDQSRG